MQNFKKYWHSGKDEKQCFLRYPKDPIHSPPKSIRTEANVATVPGQVDENNNKS